jgi:tRNA nucleotidyltransferase/poly(A) polymerase
MRTFDALASIIAPFTTEAYYVGGCVRDCLLGRPIKDVDIAMAADPRAVGEAVRGALGGHFFWLRERDGTARVFRPEPDGLQVDIVALREPIEADLRRRDYTVNAMAIPVAAGLRPDAPILDPTGGRADLDAKRLRLAGADALRADPLRALRGVRLSVELGFVLDAATAAELRRAGPWLERVSRERIRDEFFLCLAARESAAALQSLREFRLLEPVLPEMAPGLDEDVWQFSLAHVEAVIRLLANLPFPPALAEAVRHHLAQPLAALRDRATLLRLGALLWRLPAEREPAPERPEKGAALRKTPGVARDIGRHLALSGPEATWIARVLAHRATPREWLAAGASLGSPVYRFWRNAGDAAADVVLLMLAYPDRGAAEPRLERLLDRFLSYERGEHPPLLSGQEVMAITGLSPGPDLGHLIEALAEAQADGVVRTPADARQWVAARHGDNSHGEGEAHAEPA